VQYIHVSECLGSHMAGRTW